MARRILFSQQSVSTLIDRAPNALDDSEFYTYSVQSRFSGSGAVSKDVILIGNIFDDGDIELNLQGLAYRVSGSLAGSVNLQIGDDISGSYPITSISSGSLEVVNINVDLKSTGYNHRSRQDIKVSLDITGDETYLRTIDPSGSATDPIMLATHLINPVVSIEGTASGSSGDWYINAGANGKNDPYGYLFYHRELFSSTNDEGAWLRYDGGFFGDNQFEFSNDIAVGHESGFISPRSSVAFFSGSTYNGPRISYFQNTNTFSLTRSLEVTGDLEASGDFEAEYIKARQNLLADSNLHLNVSGPDGDSFVYFYENGSANGAYLQWDDSSGSFAFNRGLKVGSANNFTEIADEGKVRLRGAAEAWDDIRIVPGAFQFPGVSDPSLQNYQPGGSGVTYKVYKFQEGDEVHVTVQLPHAYNAGTDLRAHVHWNPGDRGNEENGNVVAWKLDYSWANIGGVFPPSTTVSILDTCDGTDDKHQMSTSAIISGSSKSISSMLICRFRRDSVGDTWAGTTAAQSPIFLEFDLHYRIDSFGSDSAVPGGGIAVDEHFKTS